MEFVLASWETEAQDVEEEDNVEQAPLLPPEL